MNAWHDQDQWWEATAQVLFRPEAWAQAPQQVEQVLALAAVTPPARVLDIPCGVGRHTLEFARLGCTVTGVDRTSAYLTQVEEQAAELGLNIDLVQADMREFQRPNAYDLAVNLFTSFGFFEDQNDDRQVLANFYTSLHPGGVLVMDMIGKEILARQFVPRDWYRLEDGTLILQERKATQDWSWLENQWIIIKEGEQRVYPFSHRVYGASDLKRELADAGFESIHIYGDLSGLPYDHTAKRLIAVARKPGS